MVYLVLMMCGCGATGGVDVVNLKTDKLIHLVINDLITRGAT